jgi:hypothetical protein
MLALILGLGAAGLMLVPAHPVEAQDGARKIKRAKITKAARHCAAKRGRGWAPTEEMARFQAWEIVAQTTGNWPFMSDTFRNERYKCAKDGSGWRCDSWIDVCKS